LEELFQEFGRITDIQIKQGYAFIVSTLSFANIPIFKEFDSAEIAKKAIEGKHDSIF